MTAAAEVSLSGRQMAMLRFLRDYIRRHDYAPCYRDIQDGVGISSTSVVAYNLKMLERKGLITIDPERARSIHLTGRRRMVSVPIIGCLQDGGFLPLWAARRR